VFTNNISDKLFRILVCIIFNYEYSVFVIMACVRSYTALINSMELSSREAASPLATPEIPSILRNVKVQYRIHEPPTGPYPEPN
jgi:hypothetical protein